MFLYHLRHATRRLRREPGFALAAILTLAIGIGANVAVFSVVEAVLLRPLPYSAPDQLAVVINRDERTGRTKPYIAVGDYVDILNRQQAFETFGGYGAGQITIFEPQGPYTTSALQAAPQMLLALRARAVVGRSFTADDGRPGAPPVALLGFAFWSHHYGSDPAVIGRSLKIGSQDVQVVGVVQPGFAYPPTEPTDVILAMRAPLTPPEQRKSGWTFALARLKSGRTLADANADLAAIAHQMAEEHPSSNQASSYFAMPLRDSLVGSAATALWLLLGAVVVVLCIASVNVANLLLARTLARRRELAVRVALGADRGRIAGDVLSESLVLAFVGGVVGILLAYWGAPAVVSLVRQDPPIPGLQDVHISIPVLAFAVGLVLLTALAVGWVTVASVPFDGAAGALVGGARLTVGGHARRTTSMLVMVESGLAVVLLIGAGLILRSFTALVKVDPGFRPAGVLTMTIALPGGRYSEIGPRDAYYRQAFAVLRTLPGVQEVGAAAVMPLTGNNWSAPFQRAEQSLPSGERPPEVGWQLASGGYFRALGIPLLAGRVFNDGDRPDGKPVVIVSKAVQHRFFGDSSAVGHLIKQGDQTFEIVGVVGDIRRTGLTDDPWADLYFPFESSPTPSIILFLRTSADPGLLGSAALHALRGIEPNTVELSARTLTDVVGGSIQVTTLVLSLLTVFAGVALALAGVGIYAVMSYAVRQRRRELGTRIALGATSSDIVRLVVREGGVMTAVGIAVGLVVGLVAARALKSLLFGVASWDPVTVAIAVSLLATVTVMACYLPARRAARTDPVVVLGDS